MVLLDSCSTEMSSFPRHRRSASLSSSSPPEPSPSLVSSSQSPSNGRFAVPTSAPTTCRTKYPSYRSKKWPEAFIASRSAHSITRTCMRRPFPSPFLFPSPTAMAPTPFPAPFAAPFANPPPAASPPPSPSTSPTPWAPSPSPSHMDRRPSTSRMVMPSAPPPPPSPAPLRGLRFLHLRDPLISAQSGSWMSSMTP